MNRYFLSLILLAISLTTKATNADWYLYLWSSTNNNQLADVQFETTNDANIFKISNYELTETSVNFCVHNNAWSSLYGWDSAAVSATGTAVSLSTATQATGWISIPAGTYDITFNASTLNIQFDTPNSRIPEDEETKVVTKTTNQTIDNVTYDLYSDGHAVVKSVNDTYLRGGDISELTYVEDLGAKFYDADGNEKDALQIMKENGVNFVRLRLYNNPGAEVSLSGTTYKVPSGYLDETDVLKLAKRAKALGMKIELTFHYSDFWTNGGEQFKPSDWSSYTLAQLKTAMYDYTYNFLQKMNAQGTTPDYVSLGNEIQAGLLFGELTSSNNYTSTLSVNGQATSKNASNLAALFNQASKAVRTACPSAKIILHFTLSTVVTEDTYNWLLGTSNSGLGLGTSGNSNYVDFDIVGASYYPYWTKQKPTMLITLANDMYSNYGKDLMIMEVGYSWTQYCPSGRYNGNYEGQLSLNGTCYNEATEAGQKSFMQEVQTIVKGNDHILGYLYWDPVMVEQKVNGSWITTNWALKKSGNSWIDGGNVVGNTTWFDYDGKALPVFEAIKEDAVIVPSTITVDGTTYTTTREEPIDVTISSVGYGTFYADDAYAIPSGLQAYTATYSASKKALELNEVSDAVPAETGVVLKGDANTYYFWQNSSVVSSVANNDLYGTSESQAISTPSGSYYYYKLANDATNGLGWYWGSTTGGSFTNGAHKAYLAIPQSSAAKAFIAFESDTDGISEIDSNFDADYYCNLSGQRILTPRNGEVYIHNGKVYINK